MILGKGGVLKMGGKVTWRMFFFSECKVVRITPHLWHFRHEIPAIWKGSTQKKTYLEVMLHKITIFFWVWEKHHPKNMDGISTGWCESWWAVRCPNWLLVEYWPVKVIVASKVVGKKIPQKDRNIWRHHFWYQFNEFSAVKVIHNPLLQEKSSSKHQFFWVTLISKNSLNCGNHRLIRLGYIGKLSTWNMSK